MSQLVKIKIGNNVPPAYWYYHIQGHELSVKDNDMTNQFYYTLTNAVIEKQHAMIVSKSIETAVEFGQAVHVDGIDQTFTLLKGASTIYNRNDTARLMFQNPKTGRIEYTEIPISTLKPGRHIKPNPIKDTEMKKEENYVIDIRHKDGSPGIQEVLPVFYKNGNRFDLWFSYGDVDAVLRQINQSAIMRPKTSGVIAPTVTGEATIKTAIDKVWESKPKHEENITWDDKPIFEGKANAIYPKGIPEMLHGAGNNATWPTNPPKITYLPKDQKVGDVQGDKKESDEEYKPPTVMYKWEDVKDLEDRYVLINKCSNQFIWYKNLVGNYGVVKLNPRPGTAEKNSWCLMRNGVMNYILFDDAIEITKDAFNSLAKNSFNDPINANNHG